MENQDFLQLSTINSSIPNLGQQQSNLLPSDLIQPPDTNLNRSGSFNDQTKVEIVDIIIKVVDYNQYVHENVFGKSTSEFLTPTTTSEIPTISDNFDPLTGDITSFNGEAVLDLAVTAVKQQLESFTTDEEFFDKMNLAFGDDPYPQEAHALIQDLVSGEAIPKIEILPAANLNANGAFGENTIFLSEKFLTENVANSEAVAGVLLEEIGHYVDQELNIVDSPGDEGDIFARLVQGKTIAGSELTALKAEDDSTTISLDGKEFAVELAGDPSALVPIPLDFNGVPINEGLTSPDEGFITEVVGNPGNPETGVVSPELEQLLEPRNVGPFEVYGLTPAVEAVAEIFAKVKEDNLVLYEQLGYSGMHSLRPKIDVDSGPIPGTISNHSWGTAIDININGEPDLTTDGLTNQGLVDLYPYFHDAGFYWGGAFETNEDPIHFEASEELIAHWEAEGLLTPGAEPLPLPSPPPTVPPVPLPPPYPGYLLEYEEGAPLEYDPAVEQWQKRMEERGWDVDVDGFYGPQSESIARQFQQAKDLAIDGIVGSETWEATFETGTPPFPSYLFKYESGQALSYDTNVEQWQQRMKDLGKNIDVDGLYGPQSAQVAHEFQQQEGLSIDGIVGPQTWEASFDTDTPPPVDTPPLPPLEGVTPDPLYSNYSGEITFSSNLSPNMRAFLDTISYPEGTYQPQGYRTLFGGEEFADFAAHPNVIVTSRDYASTAAGRYQFLYDTWEGVQSDLGLPDFSPESQDLGAVQLIENQGAVENVEAGNFEEAVAQVAGVWASLPGSTYGQPTPYSLEELRAFYQERLAAYGVA